jgi:hypothetical protein
MALGVSGPAGLGDALRGYLRPGEELLWHGGPARSFTLAPADTFLIPFSVMWLAFACFWETGVARSGSVFGAVWGLPFIALGLYAVAGRFVYKRYQHRHTAYGVTSDRAIVVTPRSFRDLSLRGVPVTVYRSRDGRRVSVIMSQVQPQATSSFLGRQRSSRVYERYADTGMEPLMRSAQFPFAFYDVEEPEALLAAIERARTQDSW